MRIGVLGTGMVGQAIGSRLVTVGHQVMMGSRTAKNEKAVAWAKAAGARGGVGTFADAAAFGDSVFNCTQGARSLEALDAASAGGLSGKVLVDVANLLPPPPQGSESLGEQIQKAFPLTRVVKTLNTVNCDVMVDPRRLGADHTVFLSGDDSDAKSSVRGLLESFGWTDIIDLGGIATARATEAYVALWLSLWRALGTAAFNIKVAR